jgi:hypothetical protein
MTAALRKIQDTTLEIEPVARPAAPKMTVVSTTPARTPDELLRLLFVNPQDGILVDELLAFDAK